MTELRNLHLYDPASGRAIEVDPITDALCMIQYGHHEVHEGDLFGCSAVDTAMGAADTLSLCFKTMAATKRAHLVVEFATLGKAHLDVVEAPTWDASTGTLAPIYNRNRSSGNTSVLEEKQSTGSFIVNNNLNANPTTLAAGTIIDTHYVFAAIKSAASGRDTEERILAAETLYAIRLTTDAASNAGFIRLSWYEHTDAA